MITIFFIKINFFKIIFFFFFCNFFNFNLFLGRYDRGLDKDFGEYRYLRNFDSFNGVYFWADRVGDFCRES
jgi:hypothetical protein